jgi:hypothetical protein
MPILQEIISNTENSEYVITRLNKDNLKDLAILHSEVYSIPVSNDYFFKKYDTAYTGIENVGYIVYNRENRPVAYYGVIPCFVRYKNEVILAAQSADTMTHPKHRYKGMFVELSNKTFDLCRELNIRLVFGFPNQNSYHGAVNKLGWKMTEKMSCFIIPVKCLPVGSLSEKNRLLRKIYERYRQFVLRNKSLSLPGIRNSVIADNFGGVYRSGEYLSYKSYNPTSVIKVDDSKIWISYKNGLFIGDMENVNEKNFKDVMNKLKKIAKRIGVKQIQFHSSSGTSLHKLFSRDIEPTPSYPVLFQDFSSPVAPENFKFTFADIDIF